ncbi:thiamine pyrophosphate-binding protein [Profundibacter amoris]|uniref:Thiamine pyrophosphate-binding protein n=1 Tax=Profundibacter amoris TaxID=2171755 RepID=A0A347UEC3_9RHOB|nr:thiamine pyrophosphate-binding protein [Profundibacter amoris]AXX97201.1 thiamine pyrophosphate-binding protein [Profundibacter amoris]
MNAAQIIANGLAGAGCRHAFGMPGGEVLALLDTLRVAGIEFTLVKHENAGGYMAEGSWHATGAPGILLATIGPGVSNAVNTVANAYQEQVPLIVLTGCISHAMAEQFTHQVIDHAALFSPVTKATLRVEQGTAALTVDKALSIALSDPPGPVLLELPDEYLDAAHWQEPDRAPAAPNLAEAGIWAEGSETLQQARDMLQNAKKPIILAGLGAIHHAAGPAILDLAEKHQVPVITTYKAKGILPEDHPMALGGHGLSPLSDKTILPLLAKSDCVILAGYDPIEMRSDWINPWQPDNAIEIMHAANAHGMHGAAVRFVGDVAQALTALGAPDGPVWPDGEPAVAKAELENAFAIPTHWGPHQLFAALNAALPENAITTVDSGAHRILLSQIWRCKHPNSLLQSAAFCTMGVAVPLAIGYKRAEPDVPVVAVVGDAGFDMTTGDLATLRDMQVPMVIVVPVDNSLALIEKKQTMMQLKTHGVQFAGTDIVAVARAYGGIGEVIYNRDDLLTALADAWGRNTFTVLACPVDKSAYSGAF